MGEKDRDGKHPDYFLTFQDLVEQKNLTFSSHSVETEDGCILSVYRVKHPNTPKGAPVIFLQHGLLGTAEHFIMNDELSPVFVLVRAGYDVWLGNSRGSAPSRKHKTLNPDKDK
jgi:lysosomal acid lipase/cholesteryl ester hydrolase